MPRGIPVSIQARSRALSFEESLRSESSVAVLQGAILGGVKQPETYINTLIAFAGERRAA